MGGSQPGVGGGRLSLGTYTCDLNFLYVYPAHRQNTLRTAKPVHEASIVDRIVAFQICPHLTPQNLIIYLIYIAKGIKQMTILSILRWGDYLELFEPTQCDHRVHEQMDQRQERDMVTAEVEVKMKKGLTNQGIQLSLEDGKDKGFSPGACRKRTTPTTH
jgi:hypothetical protein